MELEKYTDDQLKEELEDRGFLVYDDYGDALDNIPNYEIEEYLGDSNDDDDDEVTDDYIVKYVQRQIEHGRDNAKTWLCDIFGMMHTVTTEELINKITKAL